MCFPYSAATCDGSSGRTGLAQPLFGEPIVERKKKRIRQSKEFSRHEIFLQSRFVEVSISLYGLSFSFLPSSYSFFQIVQNLRLFESR